MKCVNRKAAQYDTSGFTTNQSDVRISFVMRGNFICVEENLVVEELVVFFNLKRR